MNMLDKVSQAGVVGAGGAGFPTQIKLNCETEYLIINGAECEPLLKTDQYIMREKAQEIISTVEIMAEMVKASKIVIGLKKKYKAEIKSLKEAIKELKADIELYYLDNFYPAGDEQILVYEVTERTIPPGGIPLDIGAVVSNVATVKNIYQALKNKAVTDRYISVLGEVEEPSLLKVPVGTSIAKCIKEVGGVKIDQFSVILGGPMMGKIIDASQIEDEVITKTDGAIIVVPKDHYIIKRNEIPIEHIINQAKSACIQCSYCTQYCPRYLIGHPLEPHKIMRAISYYNNQVNNKIFEEALLCCECGVCELYACPMGLSPRQVNVYLKDKLREINRSFEAKQNQFLAKNVREYRKIPVNRLIARIGLKQYQDQKLQGCREIEVAKVKLPLKQHIGAPARSIVSVGDRVSKGELVGRIAEDRLGANIHASIAGEIIEVGDRIIIQSRSEEVVS